MKGVKNYTYKTFGVAVIFILGMCFLSYVACNRFDRVFYQSWISQAGETAVAGCIFIFYGTMVTKIFVLINDVDLDLVQRKGNFCGQLSVVGAIFLVTALQTLVNFTKRVLPITDSTFFTFLAII